MASSYEIPPDLLPYLLHEKIDDSTLQSSLLKVNIVFIVTIIVATSLRFTVRFRMLGSAGLDDILMVLALIFALLLSTSCLIGEGYGLGKHIWNLTPNLIDLPAQVGRATKALYGCYLAYSTSITFTKFSIMATYIRIFPNGPLRYSIYGIGAVVAVFWVTSIFTIIFTCVPVQAAWDYSIKNPRCIRVLDYFYTSAAVNIATDLLLCFLPLPTIWRLQMPKAQRVVVCLIFAMGTFACVASMLRLTTLHNLSGIDITYQVTGSLNWSVIEVGTAIVCASLSSLRPLATRYLPSIFSHFTQPTSDRPSIRLDTMSTLTTKATKGNTQLSSMKSVTDKGNDSRIYVQRSFKVTELGGSQNESEVGQQGVTMGIERKPSDAAAAWAAGSRGSSQENLVRDPGLGTAK